MVIFATFEFVGDARKCADGFDYSRVVFNETAQRWEVWVTASAEKRANRQADEDLAELRRRM